MKQLPKTLRDPLEKISQWLAPLGYTLSIEDMEDEVPGLLGQYENGSVFEKEILIRVSTQNIRTFIKEYNRDFPKERRNYTDECALTVFHEVGHALMEQLNDYADNIEGFLERLKVDPEEPFSPYFDVFYDDNKTEEEVVEDFAWGFLDGSSSKLQKCMEETDRIAAEL